MAVKGKSLLVALLVGVLLLVAYAVGVVLLPLAAWVKVLLVAYPVLAPWVAALCIKVETETAEAEKGELFDILGVEED